MVGKSMGKGPGLYSTFGKIPRDILYKDYERDHKFSVTTSSPYGLRIISSGTNKGDYFCADVATCLKKKNVTTHIQVDTFSNVFYEPFGMNAKREHLHQILSICYFDYTPFETLTPIYLPFLHKLATTITVDKAAPGFKTILSCNVPDQRTGKLELQYQHKCMGLSASVGLAANPIVKFSGVIGTRLLALGTDVSFDSKTRNFTKYNVGLNFASTDLIASLNLESKGDRLKGSYYHLIHPKLAVGAEVAYKFSTNTNTITVGVQKAVTSWTHVKAKINNLGKASALIQHKWRSKSFVTLSAEVDTKAIDKSLKFGLALDLNLATKKRHQSRSRSK